MGNDPRHDPRTAETTAGAFLHLCLLHKRGQLKLYPIRYGSGNVFPSQNGSVEGKAALRCFACFFFV